MFAIKVVTKFVDVKQVREVVIEVPKYEVYKRGHGLIEIVFPFDSVIGYSMIISSKFKNTKAGIASEKIYITNNSGNTIDTLEASDTFDTLIDGTDDKA